MPVVFILLLIRSINHSAYRTRLLERFGFISSAFKPDGIVVHAASVGEVLALKPFINRLISDYPQLAITVTTFTPTGSAQVKKLFDEQVQHCYLPLDNPISTALFLKVLKPKVMVFMETELWPNLIAQASSRHSKLLLINGRLSDKSMRSYQKLNWLISPTIQRFDQILTQSQVNQDNYLAMGAIKTQCALSGNLKFDMSVNEDVDAKTRELSSFLMPDNKEEIARKIWLVASTHQGDEALALKSFEQIQKQHQDLLLIIVPRHPERFSQVVTLCQQAGNNVIKRSSKARVTPQANIWIIDTLGELLSACALADVITMGGSFNEIGGHNPLEPALFKKPVIVGPNMSNFVEILAQLKSEDGILQLNKNNEIEQQLAQQVTELLDNENKAKRFGENAFKVVQANQGATEKTLAVLHKLINI
jgi:3-deoxy-D-manno-octulosonic-acid transferase